MTTWTLHKPLDLSTLEFLSGDAAARTTVTSSSHYRLESGSFSLDLFGRGLRYADDALLPFGEVFRLDLSDSLEQALQVLDVVWDLLHILSYYNPLTDHWDTEGLLDYLFHETDWFEGSDGDDTLQGRGGDDVLHGGGGIDVARYQGLSARYAVAADGNGFTVTDRQGAEGRDALAGIERLHFADGSLALDLDGHAGTVARLVGALWGPQQLADGALIGVGLQLLDDGLSIAALAQLAVSSDAFAAAAGSHSNADFVQTVYRNVTGGSPTTEVAQYFEDWLDSGTVDQATLALLASETDELAQRIDLAGLAANGLAFVEAG